MTYWHFFMRNIELNAIACYVFINSKGLIMFASIQLGQWASFAHVYQPTLLNFLPAEPTKRIKEIAFATFAKISGFLRTFNNQSNEINIKAIAMISCLSLVALMVISMLRHRDAQGL